MRTSRDRRLMDSLLAFSLAKERDFRRKMKTSEKGLETRNVFFQVEFLVLKTMNFFPPALFGFKQT